LASGCPYKASPVRECGAPSEPRTWNIEFVAKIHEAVFQTLEIGTMESHRSCPIPALEVFFNANDKPGIKHANSYRPPDSTTSQLAGL
jgi:hypothetical protein